MLWTLSDFITLNGWPRKPASFCSQTQNNSAESDSDDYVGYDDDNEGNIFVFLNRNQMWLCVSCWLHWTRLWDHSEAKRLALKIQNPKRCMQHNIIYYCQLSLLRTSWDIDIMTWDVIWPILTDIAIQGSWSCWGAWSSCRGRTMTRSRQCNNPAPSNGGLTCRGLQQETAECF